MKQEPLTLLFVAFSFRGSVQSTKATVVKILLASFSLQSRPFQSSTSQPSLVETEAMKLLDAFLGISLWVPKVKRNKSNGGFRENIQENVFKDLFLCRERTHTHVEVGRPNGLVLLEAGLLLALCCMLQVSWPMSF